jgi:hypothetical protein
MSPASNSPDLVPSPEFDQTGSLRPLSGAAPPMGFVPLRRLRSRQPTCTGLPHPCVAPSGFVGPLGALLLPRPPRPCFVPRTPVGFTLRSFFLRGEGAHLSMRPCPHAVGSTVRGFRRAPRPAAGLYSHRKSVARPPRGPGGRLDAPLGFHLSRGFFPSVMARGFPQAASHELGLRACSPECRSRAGRFVSAETTAPLEVRAPRAASRRSRPARPWIMVSPQAPVASLLLARRFGSSPPLPQATGSAVGALSSGSPPPGVTRHPALRSPDFPPVPAQQRRGREASPGSAGQGAG